MATTPRQGTSLVRASLKEKKKQKSGVFFFPSCLCPLPIAIHTTSRVIFLNGESHHAIPLFKTLLSLPVAFRLELRISDMARKFPRALPHPLSRLLPTLKAHQALSCLQAFDLAPAFCTCSSSIYSQALFLLIFQVSAEISFPQRAFSQLH